MKFNLFFILLIAIPVICLAQKKTVICGKVNNSSDFIINIYTPLNGFYNISFIDTSIINSGIVNGKDSIYKAIELNNPCFVTIILKTGKKEFIRSTDILVFPGDSVNLHYNLSMEGPKGVTFQGSNAAGQKLFNEINYKRYEIYQPVFDILNNLPDNKESFIREINDYITKRAEDFKLLKDISPQFKKTMDICFRMLIYGEVMNKLTGGFKQSEILSKKERNTIVDTLINTMGNITVDVRGIYNSELYFNGYYSYLAYKKYNLNSITELYKNTDYSKANQRYVIDKSLASMAYIEDIAMQRDLWAINILSYAALGISHYDQSIADQYCAIFPDNKWELLLKKQIANYSNAPAVDYKLQSPVLYIDTTKKINQLGDLLKQLPAGKPVFVDCWATWCGPCVGAFAYNKQLDSFLMANKVEKLYISIDNSLSRIYWKKSIVKYCLGGYHILANQALITDIKRKCKILSPEHSPIEIPRYLIINKNGILVINDAISPHDFESLKTQIIQNIL